MNFNNFFLQLLSSNHCIIYISTDEEERLEFYLNKTSKKLFKTNICIWDFIEGYTNNPAYNNNYAKKSPLEALNKIEESSNCTKFFLLKDFQYFMDDLAIIRKLKNINKILQKQNKYIIISSNQIKIPDTLKEYITLINFPFPNQKEIILELERLFNILKINDFCIADSLSIAYKGFSINKIRQSICSIDINKLSEKKILEKIFIEKKQLIQKTQILEFYHSLHDFNKDIAGLKNLKKWLKIRKQAFGRKAQNYGLSKPRGILLVGIQGTGKSLSAKAISSQWKLPLLKLDIGNIFNSLLGESEKKLKKMIHVCETIAPCILWIDEIDKIFTTQKNSNDGGTSARINNIFLTWLSEKTSSVFIVATANDINLLPIELLRKGRFDEIFFVDLPNFYDRLNIFQIHLKKFRPTTWQYYNLHYLSHISNKLSGSEIEQCIVEAMYNAFDESREFGTYDIVYAIKNIIPLAFTYKNNIQMLKEWVKTGKIKTA